MTDLRNEGIPWADLADGASVPGKVGDDDVIVVRVGNDVFAVGATCTHYSGPLAEGLVVGTTVRCPWHHACFDLKTGEALRAPAFNPLPCWSVERRGDRVYVGDKRDAFAHSGRPVSSPRSVVIIGLGAAGASAAEMLRRREYDGAITVIDDDSSSPVDRPNLSKDYLSGHAQPEWIPLWPEHFADEHRITIRRAHAKSLDLSSKQVVLGDGQTVRYDALILAMGSEPNHLNIPGAMTLRSFADANAIIEAAEHTKRAVVIGSSFIGLEVAASLRERKVEVDVVSQESRPLERIVDPRVSTMIRSLHEKHGVRFHMGAEVAKIEPSQVTLRDGSTIEAGLVIAGIGVKPRIALAQAAGLAIDNGVLVNEYLETSKPGVWAAGDIARWPDPHTGHRLRIEHWVVAERQGQIAAENVLGLARRFDVVPYFWSQHYDTTVRYLGFSLPWQHVAIDGDLAAHHAAVVYRASKTVGFATLDEDRLNLEAEVAMERNDEKALDALVPPRNSI
ncbi:MAG TPA: FAD-dependent oxidoreductase [Gemmatimonadaceae bacterium]|nr:FAD-dependent oxidoreductase [Gemmatimonadaceae bacterium]